MPEDKIQYQHRTNTLTDNDVLEELPRLYDLNKLTPDQFVVLQDYLRQLKYFEDLYMEAWKVEKFLKVQKECFAPLSEVEKMQKQLDDLRKEIAKVSNERSSFEQEHASVIKSLLEIGRPLIESERDAENKRLLAEWRQKRNNAVRQPVQSAPSPSSSDRPNIRKESTETAVKQFDQKKDKKENSYLSNNKSEQTKNVRLLILFLVGLFLFFLIGFVITRCDGQSTVEPIETVSETDAAYKEGNYYIRYSAKCVTNDSVGNEWGYGLMYDGEEYESRSHITITNTTPISIRVFATEYDSDDDYGSAKIDFDSLTSGEVITKEATVTVRENKGRYKGNRAVWEFTVTLERCDRDEMQEHSHNSDPESDSIKPANRNKSAETPKQISALDVIKCVLCVLVFMAGMLVVGVLPFLYFLINSLVQFVADNFFKADVTESFVKGVTLTILGLIVLIGSIIIGIVLYNSI